MPGSFRDAKQVNFLVNLYKQRPELFTEEKVEELRQAAVDYGIPIPAEAHDNYLVELPKQLLGGFIREFTIFVDPFDEPKTVPAAIAKSIGGVFGFVGSFFGAGYPLKALGKALGGAAVQGGYRMAAANLAAKGAAEAGEQLLAKRLVKAGTLLQKAPLRSMPMLAADLATKGLGKVGAFGTAMQSLRGVHPMLRQMTEQGLHLGFASAAASAPEGLTAMIQGGLTGTLFGGGFAAIGNASNFLGASNTLSGVARAAAGGIFQGLPSTLQGATTAEQVYNYLLGAYFGLHSTDVHSFEAMKAMTSLKPAEQPGALSNPRILAMNLSPEANRRLAEMVKATFAPMDTASAMRAILDALGPAGPKVAETLFEADLYPKEMAIGAEIPLTDRHATGIVRGAFKERGKNYFTVEVKDPKPDEPKMIKVSKRDVNYRLTSERVRRGQEGAQEIIQFADGKAADGVKGTEDFDGLYAELASDPISRWVSSVVGPVRAIEFEAHRRNILGLFEEARNQAIAKAAEAGTTDRGKIFDAAMEEFATNVNKISQAARGKDVDNWGEVSQWLNMNINTELIPVAHFSSGRLMALKATADNPKLAYDPKRNTVDLANPVTPIHKAFPGTTPAVRLQTYADPKSGRIYGMERFLQANGDEVVDRLWGLTSAVREFRLSDAEEQGGFYISSGHESKGQLWMLRYLFDGKGADARIAEVVRELPAKERETFLESLEKKAERARTHMGMTLEEYKRQWASNLEYFMRTFGKGKTIKEIFGSKVKGQYVNNLLDLNKRLQVLFNKFYPLSPGLAGQETYRHLIVADYASLAPVDPATGKRGKPMSDLVGITGPDGVPFEIGGEVSDGAVFMLQSKGQRVLRATGLPKHGGFGKPFGWSEHPTLGTMLNKDAWHFIPDNSPFGKWMKRHKYDQIIFTSSAKQYGSRVLHALRAKGDSFEAVRLDGKPGVEAYEMPVSDWNLSYGVYDKGGGNDPAHLAKQFWTNMVPEVGGRAAADRMADILTAANQTSGVAKATLEAYLEGGKEASFADLFRYGEDGTLSSDSLIFQVGIQDLLKAMRANPKFERHALMFIMRDAIDSTRKGGRMENEMDYEGDQEIKIEDLRKGLDLLSMADLKDGVPTNILKMPELRKMVGRVLHNFFVKRITRPRMPGSFKAIMRGWDPWLLQNPNTPYSKDHFYLDNGFRELMIDGYNRLGERQRVTLEQQFKEYRELEAELKAETTSESIDDSREILASLAKRKKALSLMKEAMQVVVLRVPMDNISGARVLEFGGFSDYEGGGILLHHDVMKALGGADLDIDSAFGYFNIHKDIRSAFIKNAEAFSRYNDPAGPYRGAAEVLKSQSPLLSQLNLKGVDVAEVMDPFARAIAGMMVSQGREMMLPIAVSSKFTIGELRGALYDRALAERRRKKDAKEDDPLTVKVKWGYARPTKKVKPASTEKAKAEELADDLQKMEEDSAFSALGTEEGKMAFSMDDLGPAPKPAEEPAPLPKRPSRPVDLSKIPIDFKSVEDLIQAVDSSIFMGVPDGVKRELERLKGELGRLEGARAVDPDNRLLERQWLSIVSKLQDALIEMPKVSEPTASQPRKKQDHTPAEEQRKKQPGMRDGDKGQEYVILTLNPDNGEAMRALGSIAINTAADLAGVGGMVDGPTLQAMLFRLAFSKIELHKADGTIVDITKENFVDLENGRVEIDSALKDFVRDAREKMSEYESLLVANNALYGRNYETNMAWEPREIRDKLLRFDQYTYRDRPFARVVEALSEVDIEYMLTRDLAAKPALLEEMVHKYSRINDFLKHDPEMQRHFAFLHREIGLSFDALRAQFEALREYGFIDAKMEGRYVKADISTATGRRELADWTNLKPFGELYHKLRSRIVDEEKLAQYPWKGSQKKDGLWQVPAYMFPYRGDKPGTKYIKMRKRQEFLERQVRQVEDFFGKRVKELQSYPFLHEWWERVGLASLRDTPVVDTADAILQSLWRRANSIKQASNALFREQNKSELDAIRAGALPTKASRRQLSDKKVTEKVEARPFTEAETDEINGHFAALKQLKSQRDRILPEELRRAQENLSYHEKAYKDALYGTGDDLQENLLVAEELLEGARRDVLAVENRVTENRREIDARQGAVETLQKARLITKKSVSRQIRSEADVYDYENSSRAAFQRVEDNLNAQLEAHGLPQRIIPGGLNKMLDAFLLSPITNRRPYHTREGEREWNDPTIFSNTGFKTVSEEVLRSWVGHFQDAHTFLFTSSDRATDTQIKDYLKHSRDYLETVGLGVEESRPTNIHDKVFENLLPAEAKFENPEIQQLATSIIEKLRRFPAINRNNLIPILRHLFRISQPHQLTVFELQGLDAMLESWLRGPGFFREWVKWTSEKEKDPNFKPPPEWRNWTQFMGSTADEMRKHVLTVVPIQLFDEQGKLRSDYKRGGPLQHLDDNGKVTYVYAEQAMVQTPIHRLMETMAHADRYNAMLKNVFSQTQADHLGWVTRGIVEVGGDKDEQVPFFEAAWARREAAGASQDYRQALAERRSGDSGTIRYSAKDLRNLKADMETMVDRKREYDAWYEANRHKRFILEQPGPEGKPIKETLTGSQIVQRIQDGMRRWAETMYDYIQMNDGEIGRNIVFEYENGVVRVSPSESWKDIYRLYDFTGMLGPGEHPSYDLVRYAHYTDSIHLESRNEGRSFRNDVAAGNNLLFDKRGRRYSASQLFGIEEQARMKTPEGAFFTNEGVPTEMMAAYSRMKEDVRRVQALEGLGGKNDDVRQAAQYLHGVGNLEGFDAKWGYLQGYISGFQTHQPDRVGMRESGAAVREKEARDNAKSLKEKGGHRLRGVEDGIRDAAALAKNKDQYEAQEDRFWTVSNYLRRRVDRKKPRRGAKGERILEYWDVNDRIYGYTWMSEYDLDLMHARGEISPEMYFFKKLEIQRPFTLTRRREGYMPHLNHDTKNLNAWEELQVREIMKEVTPTMGEEAKRSVAERLAKVREATTKVKLQSLSDDGYSNVDLADAFTTMGPLDPQPKPGEMYNEKNAVAIRKMSFSGQQSGNLQHREYNLPGYEKHMIALEQYGQKISKALYNTFAAFQARRIVDYFEKHNVMGENTSAWSFFMRSYFRDTLGYPSIFPKDVLDESTDVGKALRLRSTPYYLLSDHMAFTKGSGLYSTYIKLRGLDNLSPSEKGELRLKLNREPSEADIQAAVETKRKKMLDPEDMANLNRFGYDMRGLSMLEGQYELMTLLASLRSAVGNIAGGAVNNAIWNGLRPIFQILGPNRMKIWSAVNPQWKTIDDVHKFVLNSGVIEQFIVEEGNLITRRYGRRGREFVDAVVAKLRKEPGATDASMLELAKKYGIQERLLGAAGWFMKTSERSNRINSFLSTYLSVRESLVNGVEMNFDNPWLIEMARRGMNATQFLYGNDTRPPFARTNLGHIYSRFKLWAWSSARFQRQIYEAARDRGYRPDTPEMDRFRRLLTANIFAVGLATLLPYSMFDATLPAPLSWFQNLADWMFGDDKERQRAFYTGSTGLPVILAPLQELLPPVARLPKGLVDAPATFAAIWGDDLRNAATLTTYSLFPFGRMAKDVWRAYNDPSMVSDVLTGLPFTTIARRKAAERKREETKAKLEQQRQGTPLQQQRAVREEMKALLSQIGP